MQSNLSILVEMEASKVYPEDTWIYLMAELYILFVPCSFPNNSQLSILFLFVVCLLLTATVRQANVFLELPITTVGFLYCVVTARSPIPRL